MEKLPISMCMIVKDEEDCLERCLNSAAELFQELVIVDTGSTDRTVDIARNYTEKIFFHPWEDDFSKARNQSLSYATQDWVFIMDADEKLEDSAYEKLKKIFIDSSAEAMTYFLCLVNVFNVKKNKQTSVYHPRLFYFKDHTFHYKSIVHNMPIYKSPVDYLDVKLFHYGYGAEIKEKVMMKSHRTLSLLQKKLQKNPDNFMDLYHSVKSYNVLQMYKKSYQTCNKIFYLYWNECRKGKVPIPMHRFTAETAGSFYFTACGFLDRRDEYREKAEKLLRNLPNAIDIYFNLACLYIDDRDFEAFAYNVKEYKRCYQLFEEQKQEDYWREVELIHRFDLGKIEYMEGIRDESLRHTETAQNHYIQSIRMDQSNTMAGVGLLRIGINKGQQSFIDMLILIRSLFENALDAEAEFINYLYEKKPPDFVEYMGCVIAATEFKDGFDKSEETSLVEKNVILKSVVCMNNLYKGMDVDIFNFINELDNCQNLKSRLILAWASVNRDRLVDERLVDHINSDEYLFYRIFHKSVNPVSDIKPLLEELNEVIFYNLSSVNKLNYRKLKIDIFYRLKESKKAFEEMETYLNDLFEYSAKMLISTGGKEERIEMLCKGETPNLRFVGNHLLWKESLKKGDKKNAIRYGTAALENATDLTKEYAAYLKELLQTEL